MPTPFFSIIVPTFQAEECIAGCLNSLAQQTCTDFELIIMDGGSSDRTIELITQKSQVFGNRLLITSEKDAGIFDAMNKAISLATGNWLYFLGADDRLNNAQVLENVVAFIQNQPSCHLAYGDVKLDSNARRYTGEVDLWNLIHGNNICHQAIFYRSDIFEKIGRYNLRYRIWADWDLNIRCFQHPDFIQRHMDLVVADFNNITGLSAVEIDKVFIKLLHISIRMKVRYILGLIVRKFFRRSKKKMN